MSIEKILDEVYIQNTEENIVPLTQRQVCNILNKLLFYPIADEDEFRTALYYSVKLRSMILFSTSHITPPYKPVYNYYTTLNYPIDIVLKTMGILDDDVREDNPTYSDNIIKEINDSVDEVVMDIKNNMEVKKRVLTNGEQTY